MNYKIRELTQSEYTVLTDFLYEAIYIPEGVDAPPQSIVNAPELQVYVSGFGSGKPRKQNFGRGRQAPGSGIGTGKIDAVGNGSFET